MGAAMLTGGRPETGRTSCEVLSACSSARAGCAHPAAAGDDAGASSMRSVWSSARSWASLASPSSNSLWRASSWLRASA
eukprot:9177885-Pyramimonas_sp.AAC.1